MFANIRAVLVYPEPSFFLYRIVLVREQFVILSRTGGLQRQSNLFPFFLSLSLDIKHELKIHILDILNAVYLLLVQIGCFYIFKKFCNSATNHTLPYRYGAERGVHTFHFIAKGGVILKPSDFQKTILKQLPEQSRNIVLMFFFLDMSDSEIGEKLNINRSTSYRHRRNSLEEIRKQLKEKKTNEE